MGDLPELLALSVVMGFSIYLSVPIVLRKAVGSRSITLFNAASIGILLFLLADIFANVAPSIYSNPANPYLANGTYAAAFALPLVLCFGLLFAVEHRPRRGTLSPIAMATIVASAVGFQNLTEGLVLGSAWAAGSVGLSTVVLVGFSLQNVTEGFPITSPLIGRSDRAVGPVAAVFLLGAVPTVVGAVGGFYYNSALLEVIFGSLAMGAILYSIVPMLRLALRPADPPASTYTKQRLIYVGIVLGFLVGFAVNLI